jgi:ribose 1,5-bisphosphate isomerase
VKRTSYFLNVSYSLIQSFLKFNLFILIGDKMINSKKREFDKIALAIKEIKIQGARNIAKNALYAYKLIPTKASIKKLKSLRPTEPMLMNVLDRIDSGENYQEILNHFDHAQEKINEAVYEKIETGDIIMTICHSTNVVNALIYSWKKGKRFEVYNLETRPLFQGRKTAKELSLNKIPVTTFVDSAMGVAISKEQGTKHVTKVFVGADALLKSGVANKIGSEVLAQIAKNEKIPFYVVADSWKYSPKNLELEMRDFHEVWDKMPEGFHIKIKNPAFELIKKKWISGIFTELGFMRYKTFLRKVKK